MTKREQFLSDILTTAVEGGINYWASIRDVKRDNNYSILSFECRDSVSEDDHWCKICVDLIDDTILQIVNRKVETYISFYNDIKLATSEEDASHIDAEDANDLVQIAAFGEIVF
jgi:hypothetical protein